MTPYARQEITESDIAEVEKVLRSDFLTQGPVTPTFEKAIANTVSVKHAVAFNSATSALHIACLALDLKKNDLLWTSPNTFVASVNCARYCGAEVDFVDIDPHTYNMSSEKLSKKLIDAEKEGKLPKIVIPVHFAGQPCDMEKIYNLSKKYNFKIIEDASHAIGATYNKDKIGSCKYSDITVFSFHPVKIITSAEGGMAMTNNSDLFDRMNRLRAHGITYDKTKMQLRPDDEIWNYQQIDLGFNYRMNEIQAALGLSQLKRLGKYIACRHEIAKLYNKEFKNLPITIPWQSPKIYSSYHLYPIIIKNDLNKMSQRKIYDEFIRNNIKVNVHYIPAHRHPYYENLGFKINDFPVAEQFHREAISLPIFPSLTLDKQQQVIEILKNQLS